MDCDKKSMPLVAVVTAGIIGGAVAGVYIYSARTGRYAKTKIRDAEEIIDQCHKQLKKIEIDAADRIQDLKNKCDAA